MSFLLFLFIIHHNSLCFCVDCNDPYSCNSLDFFNATQIIVANGYRSIYGSDTSLETTQQITCGGESSCTNLESIKTEAGIICHGQNSCANVLQGVEIALHATQCLGVNSCTNTSIAVGGYVFGCGGV